MAFMLLLAFFLLVYGWVVVLAALILLNGDTPRAIFLASGCAIQILGTILLARVQAERRRWKKH